MEFTAQQIADFLHGEVVGNPDIKVNNVSKIEESNSGTLTFLSNPKYTHYIYTSKADIILVNNDFVPEHPISATLIKVENAYQSLASLLQLVDSFKKNKTGIEPLSYVSASATIGKDPYIGAFSYIGDNVCLGKNVKIYPQSFIGDNVTLGDNVIVYSGAKIYADSIIGNRCVIHSGAVIGADGFGFAPMPDGSYNKIPQIGNVTLEDDVEIGANTTIDKATMGSTIIRKGVKLDNLIMIAHNVEIGSNTVMAAQSGIAGSTKIGENCMFGGQVGIAGHLRVEQNVKLTAQAGVGSNLSKDTVYMGAPAIPMMQFNKAYVYFRKLPELARTIDALQKELDQLRSQINRKED
jgi:UDP-3-O-[3-hydroxymyristoyl] glucosamine N-acyltransferase